MLSTLDVHDLRNYTPLAVCWEVQGKRGCAWTPLGVITCRADLTAARRLRGGYRVVRVRAAATLGVDASAWRRIRFI